MSRNAFARAERLSGKTNIDALFANGVSFFHFPFRISYREVEAQQVCPCRLLVNVPKRLHKRAVARNLIRRRIKEAYRLNKHHFYKQLREKRIQMAILYTSPKLLDYDFISQKLTEAEEMLLAKIRINN